MARRERQPSGARQPIPPRRNSPQGGAGGRRQPYPSICEEQATPPEAIPPSRPKGCAVFGTGLRWLPLFLGRTGERLSRFARLSVTEPLAMLCRLPPEPPFGLPMAGCLAPLGSPRALASAKAGSNAVFPIYFTGSQRTAAW